MNNSDPAIANLAAPSAAPVYCYAVQYVATNDWNYFVRWDKAVEMQNMPDQIGGGTKTFLPAQIAHSEVEHSGAYESKSVVVNVTAGDRRLQRYFLTASTVKIRIFIIRITARTILDSVPLDYRTDAQLVESGVVGQIAMRGMSIETTITPEPFIGTNQLPHYFFGRTCQKVFGQCGVNIELLKTVTTIISLDRDQRTVYVDAIMPALNYWRSGNLLHTASGTRAFIEWADNETTGGKGRARLRAWSSEFNIGDVVTLYPGCSLTVAACTLFSNVANFGGFPYIPQINPVTHGA